MQYYWSLLRPWFTWGVALLFYLYEFVLRVSPSTMILEWMRDLNLNAGQVGHLSATYFYAYALCQIPAGLVVDLYPLRTILTLTAGLTALGTLTICYALSPEWAYVGRGIIGLGSAFAFVSCLTLAAKQLPLWAFPIAVGLTNLCGVLGGILGGGPLAMLIDATSWREALLGLAFIGFVLTLLLFLCVPYVPTHPKTHYHHIKPALKATLHHPMTWKMALYASAIVVPITAFVELWGVPFLILSNGLSKPEAAFALSCVFIGIGVGGPSIGMLAAKLGAPRWPQLLQAFMLSTLILFSLIIFYPPTQFIPLIGLLMLYGFCASHMLLCFTFIKNWHPEFSGTALGFLNMCIMACGALFQPLMGKLIDKKVTPPELYTLDLWTFQKTLGLLSVVLLGALLLLTCYIIPHLRKKEAL